MNYKRIFFDASILGLSTIIFAIIRIVLELFLPNTGVDNGTITPGINILYSSILYIFVIIVFFLYGWLLRRWFIKNKFEKKDNSLNHTFIIFLPIFLIVLVYSVIVSFLPITSPHILITISTAFLEVIQIIVISTTIGVLLYPQIEEHLGLLVFKEILKPDETKLGLGSFQKQIRFYTKKYWKIFMVIVALMIFLANVLVFIVYPSIPASELSMSLGFALPNFRYKYDPNTGFRQDFFVFRDLPQSVIVNWKLAQSILCLFILAMMILMFYLPKKRLVLSDKEKKGFTENPKVEDSDENIAYNIINPNVEVEAYSPPHLIQLKPKKRSISFFSKIGTSSIISIMNLLCLNIAIAMLIIIIFQNVGIIDFSSFQTEVSPETSFATLTQLYWAGFNEEITFRWMLFGLPLFVINGLIYVTLKAVKYLKNRSSSGKKQFEYTGYLRKKHDANPLLYLTGGWKHLDIIGWLLLIFSSFAFGYVHYHPGSWDPWKIFQAGVGGIIFGYAYYKHGFHAAIFLHAANNFVLGFLLTPNLGLLLNGEFIFIALLFFGALLLLYGSMIVLSKFFKGINRMFGRYSLIEETVQPNEK